MAKSTPSSLRGACQIGTRVYLRRPTARDESEYVALRRRSATFLRRSEPAAPRGKTPSRLLLALPRAPDVHGVAGERPERAPRKTPDLPEARRRDPGRHQPERDHPRSGPERVPRLLDRRRPRPPGLHDGSALARPSPRLRFTPAPSR